MIINDNGKKNYRKSEKDLKQSSGKKGKNNPQFKMLLNGEKYPANKEATNKEINKEIIRRLRIQNKKLIEQVVNLKEELRKTKINKVQVLNHINELLKLIDS